MLVTLSGITRLRKEEQSRKALSPMLVTPTGITRLCKEVQPQNALSPMLVTLSRITRLLKEEQSRNASSQIILVSFLIKQVPSSSLGDFSNFIPSLLYFTPYSSIMASFNSSSVAFVDISRLSLAS